MHTTWMLPHLWTNHLSILPSARKVFVFPSAGRISGWETGSPEQRLPWYRCHCGKCCWFFLWTAGQTLLLWLCLYPSTLTVHSNITALTEHISQLMQATQRRLFMLGTGAPSLCVRVQLCQFEYRNVPPYGHQSTNKGEVRKKMYASLRCRYFQWDIFLKEEPYWLLQHKKC